MAKKKKLAKKKKPALKKKKTIKRKPIRKSRPKLKSRPKPRPQPKSRPKSKARPQSKPKPKKLDKDAVGIITHYFPHVRAAVFKAEQPLDVGDMIKIKGHTTDFMQKVTSMQIDRNPITTAKKGDEIGLQVESRVRRKDIVYKL